MYKTKEEILKEKSKEFIQDFIDTFPQHKSTVIDGLFVDFAAHVAIKISFLEMKIEEMMNVLKRGN